MPTAASAHIELEATSVAPGEVSVLTFTVGHGCDGSPTTGLAIEFPASVQAVRPTAKPGWTIETSEGEESTTVTYTADEPLPDELRDTVDLSVYLPPDATSGDVLTFPVQQTCVDGETSWDQVAENGQEPESPAPTLTIEEPATGSTAESETGAQSGSASGSSEATTDTPARVLGVSGLAVGVLGVVTAGLAMRRTRTIDHR